MTTLGAAASLLLLGAQTAGAPLRGVDGLFVSVAAPNAGEPLPYATAKVAAIVEAELRRGGLAVRDAPRPFTATVRIDDARRGLPKAEGTLVYGCVTLAVSLPGANAEVSIAGPMRLYETRALFAAPERTAATARDEAVRRAARTLVADWARQNPPASTVRLTGPAALYYLYRTHNAPTNAPIYYLSKNGRIYYRDATARVHYVTPPNGGLVVPTAEAAMCQGLQGYNGSTQGETDLAAFEGKRIRD